MRPSIRSWSRAVFVELAVGFVPVANELPLMAGVGVRLADIHEIWARAGYMPIGDDIGRGFGVAGYRVALRPRRFVRPVFGALFAALGTTCGHDTAGRRAASHHRCSSLLVQLVFDLNRFGGSALRQTIALGWTHILPRLV